MQIDKIFSSARVRHRLEQAIGGSPLVNQVAGVTSVVSVGQHIKVGSEMTSTAQCKICSMVHNLESVAKSSSSTGTEAEKRALRQGRCGPSI